MSVKQGVGERISPDRIQVLIPALNEEVTIGPVIARLQAQGLTRIRIVDNGSTDATVEVARAAGAEVMHEPRRGYGQACWTGMQQMPESVEWVLFCDADGSDVLEELPRFFACGDRDFILGDRRSSAGGRAAMTPVQNFGNWLATTLIRIGWGASYQDLGPLRLIRRDALERIAMEDRGFGWTVEMQARAAELRLRTEELPVSYRERQGGKSKISGSIRGSFRAGTIILTTLGKLYGRKLRRACDQPSSQTALRYLVAMLLIVGAWIMAGAGALERPGAVPHFLAGGMLMSLGFLLTPLERRLPTGWYWALAILPRVVLLPSAPGDDIWRYLWEGMIQWKGFSPYAVAPDSAALEAFRTPWWSLINHPEVPAVYPPLAQAGFRVLAAMGPSVLGFKLAFVAADLACCALLARRFGCLRSVVYAWNPLVIYSFAGGGHYDSWFLVALIGGCLCLEKPCAGRFATAAGAILLGSSVALKYVSLPILAFAAYRVFRTRGWVSAAAFALLATLPFIVALLLLPWSEQLVPGSFLAIVRSSEFLPYWVGKVWPASIRMNGIFALPVAVILAYLLFRMRGLMRFAELSFSTLLLFSPAIHGWYFTWLAPFAVATRNPATWLVSVSGFAYFWLKQRQAVYGDWEQSPLQNLLLWGPFLAGWLWQYRRLRPFKR